MIKLQTKDGKREIYFNNELYVLNKLDLGAAITTVSTIKCIDQIGEYLNSSTVGTREIAITGYVLADDLEEMRQRKRDLIKLINPLDTFYLIVDDYRLECVALDTIKFAVKHHENNDKLAKFVLSAEATNPCFEKIENTTVRIALWRAKFHFPLVLQKDKPFIVGVREPAKIGTVYNSGDINTGMIVEFKAKGEVRNPYIFDIQTREEIRLNKTLSAGEVVRVNTNYGNKTVKGTIGDSESNYFKYLDINSSFIILRQGRNLFRWGAEGLEDNLEVNIIFNPKFLGV